MSSQTLSSLSFTPGETKQNANSGWSDNSPTAPTTLTLSGDPGDAQWKLLKTFASKDNILEQPPTARWGHSSNIVGPEKMVVFGGYGDEKFTDHIHTYEPATTKWKRIHPKGQGHGPTPRSNHSATAVGRNLLIVHGGGKKGKFDTFHAYDTENEQWCAVKVSHGHTGSPLPPQRSGHSAALLGNQYVACFGGKISKADTSETFLLDVTDMLPDNCPSDSPPRVRPFAVSLWDGSSPSIMSSKPTARRFHSLCTHWRTGQGVMFGGCHREYECLGDVWLLSIRSQTTTTTTTPSTTSTAKSSDAGRSVSSVSSVSSASSASSSSSSSRSLSLATGPTIKWKRIKPQGKGPTPRWGHSTSMVGDHMIVIGGRAQTDLMDIHILTLSSLSSDPLVSGTRNRWSTPNVTSSSPPPRRRATICTYAGNAATIERRTVHGLSTNSTRILMFGGYDGKFQNDLYQLKVGGFTETTATQTMTAMENAAFSQLPVANVVVGNGGTATSAHPLASAVPSSSFFDPADFDPSYPRGMTSKIHSVNKIPTTTTASTASRAPAAPSAPQVGNEWGAMFPPPPDGNTPSSSFPRDAEVWDFAMPGQTRSNAAVLNRRRTATTTATSNSSNELVFGETKSNATTAASTKKKTIRIVCSDGELPLPVHDVALLRRLMPVFFMMTATEVRNALPKLRRYDQEHPQLKTKSSASESQFFNFGNAKVEGTSTATTTTSSATSSLTTKQSISMAVPSVQHPLGIRAVRLRWEENNDDISSVIHIMGYGRARTFRAIGRSNMKAAELTLNILLDLCERETETTKEDESIEASYLHALEAAKTGNISAASSSSTSSLQAKSREKQRRKQSSGNASQRVVELEAQVEEMREDLTTLLQCAISFELMKDPVVTPSGHLYDRKKIEQWIHSNHTDPSTRKSLRRSQLVSVRGLKDIADKYRGRNLLECDM